MATGTTTDFSLTRNQIVYEALVNVGLIEVGTTAPADLENLGIRRLNLLIRELDHDGNNLHALSQVPISVTLVANQTSYDSTFIGASNRIVAVVKALYRDDQGTDKELDILDLASYASITDKVRVGEPQAIYLTKLGFVPGFYVWPTISSQNAQSVVTGTDAAAYKAIRNHTADSTNRPITGANYRLYWVAGGSGPVAWATGTQYTAPKQVHLWVKRPLWDFDTASDNPDVPQGWERRLLYMLSDDLADVAGLPAEEKRALERKHERARLRTNRSRNEDYTSYHNKGRDF